MKGLGWTLPLYRWLGSNIHTLYSPSHRAACLMWGLLFLKWTPTPLRPVFPQCPDYTVVWWYSGVKTCLYKLRKWPVLFLLV